MYSACIQHAHRHIIVMELLSGYTPLCLVRPEQLDASGAAELYAECMRVLERLAAHGLIHGDLNEFNLLVRDDLLVGGKDTGERGDGTEAADQRGPPLYVLDLPQMLSLEHENAQLYFERDSICIREFFRRRFSFESPDPPPQIADIEYDSH